MRRLLAALTVLITLLVSGAATAEPPVRIASKRFVESYLLAEVVVDRAREAGLDARHELGLGGTAVVFRALQDGAVDAYPEYTGTLEETLNLPARSPERRGNLDDLRAALAPAGIALSEPLGFEDKYAIAVRREVAEREGVKTLGDLRRHPELRVALSHEFAGRSDGYPGLVRTYGFAFNDLRVLDHALAYEAVARKAADVIDVYTTDAKIRRYDLVVLEDDRHFFPPYDAVLVYRADLPSRAPAFSAVLAKLRGSIDVEAMRRMNERAEIDGVDFARVASDFLGKTPGEEGPAARRSTLRATLEVVRRHGPRHLALVAFSVALATLLGVPLGVLSFVRPTPGAVILAATGIVQTIPSLALFCFFIPLMGIGPAPALLALFLYGLLPIVRNTHAGLSSIPAELRDAARALGLSRWERLSRVELPLAARTILAGIKTSAVVAVGSATIAAFIGAGGFGEPISTGLSMNDVPMILEGAVPAAVLALVVQGAFALVERALIPAPLRR